MLLASPRALRDWDAVARDYAGRVVSIDMLCTAHAITRSMLYRQVKAQGWPLRLPRGKMRGANALGKTRSDKPDRGEIGDQAEAPARCIKALSDPSERKAAMRKGRGAKSKAALLDASPAKKRVRSKRDLQKLMTVSRKRSSVGKELEPGSDFSDRKGASESASCSARGNEKKTPPAKRRTRSTKAKARMRHRSGSPDLAGRLIAALEQKMTEFEHRIAEVANSTSAADSERDARTLNTLARLFEKLKKLEVKAPRPGKENAEISVSSLRSGQSTKDKANADPLRDTLARRIAVLREQFGG